MQPVSLQQKQWDEMYEKYADMLYHLALSHMQNREDAEDVVQDVFVRYCHTRPVFADAQHEKAWMLRVTVNRCHDAFRHGSRRNHVPLQDLQELADSTGIEDSSTLELMRLLGLLPEKYRNAVVLHHLEGFSVEETAGILHIGKSAVKMRLSRARQLLKDHLEQEDGRV